MPESPSFWQSWGVKALLIASVSLWIYWPALLGGFVWDDDWYITNNQLLQNSEGLWKFWFQPGSWVEYYPVHETVLWCQWQLWGQGTLGYHLTSLFFHVVSALLVWRLLSRFDLHFAWLGGLIFAVHPVQVESVAYISELKNTLSLPFFLLAMAYWIDYNRRHTSGDYAFALGFFLVGMFCKITMAPLPVILLLYAWWKRGRITASDFRAVFPFFVISLFLGFFTIWVGQRYEESGNGQPDIVAIGGLLARLTGSGSILAYYLSRAFLPVDYMPTFPKWHFDASMPWGYLMWALIATGSVWFWSKRQSWGRHALLGFGFFLLTLAPFLGLNAVSYMEFTWVLDHFLYVPLIGLIGLAVAALGDIATRYRSDQPYLTGSVTVVVALMAMESHAFANLFVNDATLWTYALQRDPNNWIAHNNLGGDLDKEGHVPEAISHYKEVVRINPAYSDGHYNLGRSLDKVGQSAAAQEQYREALKLNPSDGKIYVNLGGSLLRSGKTDEAVAQYQQAVKIIPAFARLRYNLGSLYLNTGKFPEAIEQLKVAVRLDPHLAPARENLGSALAQSGQLPAAIEQFEAALALDPGYLIARNNLGLALAQSGRTSEAIDQFQRVLALDPTNAGALAQLARLKAGPVGLPGKP